MRSFFVICAYIFLSFFCLSGQNQLPLSFNNFEYRNIGPANQGGRIIDIEALNDDFTKVIVATGSGGVWKSDNAGTTWTPIFDKYETASIGDIFIDPNDANTIWVGTGEANNRNSVSWGNGIYKSTDGGKTFQNKGLKNTHQIARVITNPNDSKDVCVCAIGHLWGYSGDRGLFQSKDGGENWEKVKNGLPDDGKTGCTDLLIDPQNPNIMYAAFYHRLRQPWHFHSGGEMGGIYKTTDGGKSWIKLKNGLPQGPTGRIGLALSEKNPNIIMALVEAEKSESLEKAGSGIYRSEDGGAKWTYVNTYNNRPFYYSQIRINPNNDQKVYVLTTRFMVSEDGGSTLSNGSSDQEVHGDFHAMWIDPHNENRYYLGADKGLSITHDHGKHFQLIDNLPIGQFYRINYDMREPYYVYGGLQDNGSYATASFTRDNRGILNDDNWKMHWGDGQDVAANPNDWTDMYSSMENGTYLKYNPLTRDLHRVSPSALNTINHWDYFDKNEKDPESANRWNWSAPMIMSPHDPSTIFVGGNHLYKSLDKGESWMIISPDLSTNDRIKRVQGKSGGVTPDNTGAETHCAIHSISISPITESVIWAGTDDGNVQLTMDGGMSWSNVRKNIKKVPEGLWVSRVEASSFFSGRAYVTFDGHRSDHFGTWIFRTDDFGKTWKQITKGFTNGEVARVIREDHRNENLLFVGTETGVWYSINRGESWKRLKLNMPTVSIYDLKIHERENDLIVGTHGRSIWILDDISPLQQLTDHISQKDFHLFEQEESVLWKNISRGGQRGHFWFAGDSPSEFINTGTLPRAYVYTNAVINYFIGDSVSDSLNLNITSLDGKHSKTVKVPANKGMHKYYWNREYDCKDFTNSEQEEIEKVMKGYVESIGHRRIKSVNEFIKSSNDGLMKRRRLESIAGGYTSLPIDEKFLIPRAEEGSCLITLSDENRNERAILKIVKDPMLEMEK